MTLLHHLAHRTTIHQQMYALVSEQMRQLRGRRTPALLSVTLAKPAVDPLVVFARGAARFDRRLFWTHPRTELSMAGLGVAWTATATTGNRFELMADAWNDVRSRLVASGDTPPFAGPLAFAGFSFDPLRPTTALWEGFPAGTLTLPQLQVTTTGDTSWFTLNMMVVPEQEGAVPHLLRRLGPLFDVSGEPFAQTPATDQLRITSTMPFEDWSNMLTSSIETMAQEGMEKVVHTRATQVQASHPFDTAHVLARLRQHYPNCYTFAFERTGRAFVGATPEQLIRLRGGVVNAMSLAGSIRRGATPEEDAQLAEELLASAKDRVEHEVVRHHLVNDLRSLCHTIDAPATPTVMKMANIQHLYTPVTGYAAPDVTIFDLVERLHPTPAVGGAPRGDAMALIRQQEPVERGWWAAPVGWVDVQGGGEFVVALRSGLLDGASATLYGGGGIVAASDPTKEYAESQLKLRPMLSALGTLEEC